MNTYKLNNIIKKDLLKKFENSQISKKRFSFKLLNTLCKTYPITEFIEEHFCCYGEDKCCWYDENTCWYNETDPKDINLKVYRTLKKSLKSNTNKFDICKRNIFIGEDDKVIFYCIPLRDMWKKDIWIIFDKTNIL